MSDNDCTANAGGWLRSSCEVSSWVMETENEQRAEGRKCSRFQKARAGHFLVLAGVLAGPGAVLCVCQAASLRA